MSVTSIPVSEITDGGAQMRVEVIRPETVNDYAEDMLEGATFPPVVVFFDGVVYWLADGFHRVEAARKIERDEIAADIREGDARDAVLYGAGANASHGLRRSQADKRRAVERILSDPEWSRWSDRKVAGIVKVDHKTVAKVRREMRGEIPTKRPNGEIPTSNGKPNGRSGSLIQDLIKTIADDILVAECQRRGLTVDSDV